MLLRRFTDVGWDPKRKQYCSLELSPGVIIRGKASQGDTFITTYFLIVDATCLEILLPWILCGNGSGSWNKPFSLGLLLSQDFITATRKETGSRVTPPTPPPPAAHPPNVVALVLEHHSRMVNVWDFWVLARKLQDKEDPCDLSFFKTWNCPWNVLSCPSRV